jgi:DegV family protein with EDD domain
MFVLDTLEFLHKGGRIGGAKRLLGSMLALKPVLQLKDGKIEPLDSVRTKKKAIATMLSYFYDDSLGQDSIHATVYHGVAEKEAMAVMAEMKGRVELKTSVITKLSPVLGVHTGPGTVGIAYYFD